MATLTANLVLDTSGFTSGMDKARGAAGRHQQEMNRASQAINSLINNIRVLGTEAIGNKSGAAWLKQTLDIEAQAQKLAQSGVITKERAVALLQKQAELQAKISQQEAANAAKSAAAQAAAAQQAQQAAAAKAAEALRQKNLANEIERARAAAERYNIESTKAAVALKSVEQNITMLRMQASGHDALAASMKQSIELEARAERLSKEAQITKKQAIALLEEERRLVTNIASQKARAAEVESAAAAKQAAAQKAASRTPREIGLPDLPLTDNYIRQTERAAFMAQNARREFSKLTRGIGGTSMGFLAFSQAVEDAQYGIKGVLNNIPQMVLGFGGSMGLAGAISLAAVAAVQLYPYLQRLFRSVDAEILKKASAEFTKVFDKGMKAAKATYENAVNAVKLKNEIIQIEQHYRKITALGQDMAAVHRANIESLKTERELQEQIYEARDRLLKLQGKKDDDQIAREKAQREIDGYEKEIEGLKKEQASLNARSSEAQSKKSLMQDFGSDENYLQQQKALSILQEELAKVEGQAAAAKLALEEMSKEGVTNLRAEPTIVTTATPAGPVYSTDKGKIVTTKSAEERKLKDAEATIEKIKADISNAQGKITGSEDKRNERIRELDQEIKRLDDLNQRSFDEEKRLKGLIAAKRELLNVESQINNTSQKQKQDAYRYELDMIKARIAGDEAEIARLERKKAIEEEIIRLKGLGAKPTSKELDSAVESEKRIQNEIQKLQDKEMPQDWAKNKVRLNELLDAEDRAAKRTNSGFEPKTPSEIEFAYKQAEKRRKEIEALRDKGYGMGSTRDAERLLQLMEIQKRKQQEINNLKKESSLESQAAKIVDSRNKANEADKQRKDNAQTSSVGGGGSPGKLGSVARFNNLMMGRAANDGLLEENRRQTNLLRTIEKNTAKKEETKQVFVPVFASGY